MPELAEMPFDLRQVQADGAGECGVGQQEAGDLDRMVAAGVFAPIGVIAGSGAQQGVPLPGVDVGIERDRGPQRMRRFWRGPLAQLVRAEDS